MQRKLAARGILDQPGALPNPAKPDGYQLQAKIKQVTEDTRQMTGVVKE